MMVEKPLNTKEAAVFLGVKPQTLINWRFERKGPDYIKMGRRVVYRLSDLKKYQEKRCIRLENEEL